MGDFVGARLLLGAARLLLGGLAGLFLTPAGLLGGRQDGDLFLLAPLCLTPRIFAGELFQRALASGLLLRRQGPASAGRRLRRLLLRARCRRAATGGRARGT